VSPDPSPLALIEDWDAPHAAAAVISRTGVLATHGDTDRVFRVASVTKLVAAYAAHVAIEEGAIALSNPAGPPGATVRHLLCHASGLDFDSDRVLAPPESRRIYSNTGYDRLATHLSDRAGIAVDEYLDEAVLGPLAMVSTTLDGSAAKDLVSTVGDMGRFVAEMLAPALLDPGTWAAATTPQFPALSGVLPGWGQQEPNPWGLGPELRGAKSPHWTGATAPPTTYGHFGGSGTFVWVDPVAGLACIVLTDRPFDDWALRAWPDFSDLVRRHFATR